MKKHLLFAILILLTAASLASAGMGMRGSIIKERPNGGKVKAEYYGDLMRSPDGDMGKARVRAHGEYILMNADDEMELRTTATISAISKKMIELKVGNDKRTFEIGKETALCDVYGKRLKRRKFQLDDVVTVSSKLDGTAATTVRKGPMFFTGVMAGKPRLVDITCTK